jgi:ubiquinone/menaquinone biosynthesis C-methylase UbiE
MEFTGERFVPELSGEIALEHLNRYYFVLNQIDLKNQIVLDIASGEGYGANLLAQTSKHVYGVDISLEVIKHSSLKYERDNLTFIQGDAVSIPLDNSSVDIVVSFETIEHHDKHHEMINEIKRVLKPNGILIISSPDKYFYTDKPMNKNDFHVKELYSGEFKDLIRAYFKKTIFYSQKVFVGSIIALDDSSQEGYRKPIVIHKNGGSTDFDPLYNIAIATDNFDFRSKWQLVLYNETYSYFTYSDVEMAELRVRKSKAYRLGKFLLKPFSYFKRFLSSSFFVSFI